MAEKSPELKTKCEDSNQRVTLYSNQNEINPYLDRKSPDYPVKDGS